MKNVVLVLGITTALLGLVAIVFPASFTAVLGLFAAPSGLWFAAGLRIVLGLVLFTAAARTRAPAVLKLLGVSFVAAGLLMPLVGHESLLRLVEMLSAAGPGAARFWGVVALLFGAFMAYAVGPIRKPAV